MVTSVMIFYMLVARDIFLALSFLTSMPRSVCRNRRVCRPYLLFVKASQWREKAIRKRYLKCKLAKLRDEKSDFYNKSVTLQID